MSVNDGAVVDIFFIIDILVTFNTGIFNNGDYEDSRKVVALAYLKDFFLVPAPKHSLSLSCTHAHTYAHSGSVGAGTVGRGAQGQ